MEPIVSCGYKQAKAILGCIDRNKDSKSYEVLVRLYTLPVLYPVQDAAVQACLQIGTCSEEGIKDG